MYKNIQIFFVCFYVSLCLAPEMSQNEVIIPDDRTPLHKTPTIHQLTTMLSTS